MRTLVQLLTGFFRCEHGDAPFNMLEDVFSKQGIDSGEAERVLVSALCEIGCMKCIYGSHEGQEKWERIFQLGKSREILIRLQKPGNSKCEFCYSGNGIDDACELWTCATSRSTSTLCERPIQIHTRTDDSSLPAEHRREFY